MNKKSEPRPGMDGLILEAGELASMAYAVSDAMENSPNAPERYLPALHLLSNLLQKHYTNFDQYEADLITFTSAASN